MLDRKAASLRTQRATLKVQDGYDYFCCLCIVPHVRGAPTQQAVAVFDEACCMIDAGFQEIVITGCNTACYAADGHHLPDLLEKLLALSGLGRIRLGSIEPGTVERAIVDLMVQDSRALRVFCICPVQHCDNDVLARMRRRYTCRNDQYYAGLRVAADTRTRSWCRSDCRISWRNEAAHQKNSGIVFAAIRLKKCMSFPYSERPGTPAATFYGSALAGASTPTRERVIDAGGAAYECSAIPTYMGRTVHVLIEKIDQDGLAFGLESEYLLVGFGVFCAQSPAAGHGSGFGD